MADMSFDEYLSMLDGLDYNDKEYGDIEKFFTGVGFGAAEGVFGTMPTFLLAGKWGKSVYSAYARRGLKDMLTKPGMAQFGKEFLKQGGIGIITESPSEGLTSITQNLITGRPVLENNRGWHIMKKLDLVAMKKGAKKLIGTKDFSTFRASSCRAKSPVKTMKLVKITSFENKVEIEFRSQSFLQQQVRSMVGCLKYLGEKKWSIKKFESVMKSKKRVLCAPPAPPEGLFLVRIIY